jgi:hypothetical protein
LKRHIDLVYSIVFICGHECQDEWSINDKNKWEIYGGVKNLLDFVPNDPIKRPFDPFDKNVNDPVNNLYGYTVDPSYNYASLEGIRAFSE